MARRSAIFRASTAKLAPLVELDDPRKWLGPRSISRQTREYTTGEVIFVNGGRPW